MLAEETYCCYTHTFFKQNVRSDAYVAGAMSILPISLLNNGEKTVIEGKV